MTMTEAQIAEVKQRAQCERERHGYPDRVPVLPPVPAGRYGDHGFAALEREAVFGRSWLFVAHADEVRHPGDYLLVDQLPQPVMLVRGHDGVVRAFYNTCMHRGTALVTERCGHAGRRLTCPYHSWVYDLDGTLVGLPDAGNFADLDRDRHALGPIRCETWGPLIFVNLDAEAAPLADHLAPVSDDLSEMAALDGRLHLVDRTVRDLPVNWKLPVDANIETYHVNTVHRDSAGRVLDQAATGIQLLRNGHSRMLITVKDGAVLTGAMPFPPLFEGLGDLPVSGTFSYHLFPNFSIVFVGHGFLFLVTNWPTGPAGSTYHVHWCSSLDPASGDEARRHNATFVGFNQTVLFEDLAVLPGMQASVDAGSLRSLTLNYQERRIYHVHEAIDRVIGVGRVPEELRVRPVLGDLVER